MDEDTTDRPRLHRCVPTRTGRRRLLAAAGAGLATALAGCSGGTAGSDSVPTPFGGWLADARGWDGEVTDRTGESATTVRVGTGPSGYRFSPVAVRVSPGTTVTWEWTGNGNRHNVVAESGAYESPYYAQEGATFSHEFTDAGASPYYCTPHRNLGMKGVVAVVEG